jgi:hypothetical protein
MSNALALERTFDRLTCPMAISCSATKFGNLQLAITLIVDRGYKMIRLPKQNLLFLGQPKILKG